MPLGLTPMVQTQALGCRHQEVHHCTTALMPVLLRVARFCEYYSYCAFFGSILALTGLVAGYIPVLGPIIEACTKKVLPRLFEIIKSVYYLEIPF